MSLLSAEVISEAAALERIAPEWSTLCDEARAGCLFLSPEWLLPWWTWFGAAPGTPGIRQPCCVALRAGGVLVGFLPAFTEQVRLGGLQVRRLAFLGDGATGCDYLDVLAARGREAEVLDAALSELRRLPWDLCDLDGLLRESPTALELCQRFPPGLTQERIARDADLRFVCPRIPLEGSYEQFLGALSRRENLRRREKWLARQPGVSIVLARTPEQGAAELERFFALHRARWAVEGGSDGLADQRHEGFHRDAVAALARRGWLRLYTLEAARRPVASVYGVVHRSRFLYYQSGYDPHWASRSPGLVLLAQTVRDAYAEGLTEFDFLRGDEGYKAQWARDQRWTVRIRLWRGARGAAARAGLSAVGTLRSALKSALPRAGVEAVKVARRILRAPRPEGESRLKAAARLSLSLVPELLEQQVEEGR